MKGKLKMEKDEFVNTCMKNLRKNLKAEMKRRKFSVVRMAIECELPYNTFCKILYDKDRNITLSTLSKIADGLGKPTETLLTCSEETENGGAV